MLFLNKYLYYYQRMRLVASVCGLSRSGAKILKPWPRNVSFVYVETGPEYLCHVRVWRSKSL